MTATLTIDRDPSLARDARRYTVDCRHGTTHADVIPGDYVLTDADALALLVVRHTV